MSLIEIMKCDRCGEEVRGSEMIRDALRDRWLMIKASGVLRTITADIYCADAIYHFCGKCNWPLRDMLADRSSKNEG